MSLCMNVQSLMNEFLQMLMKLLVAENWMDSDLNVVVDVASGYFLLSRKLIAL